LDEAKAIANDEVRKSGHICDSGCWVLVILVAATISLGQQRPVDSVPPLLPESKDAVGREIRAARARFYDVGRNLGLQSLLKAPDLRDAATPPPVGSIVTLTPLPELPLETSDVVVIGEVTNIQPFLTSSQAALYTEYTLRTVNTVKPKVLENETLLLLRRGGKTRLDDGRVVQWKVTGQGDDPQSDGRQYLFLLKYSPEIDAYLLLKMWHVENGLIKAAFPVEKANALIFRSENDGRLVADVISSLRQRMEKQR